MIILPEANSWQYSFYTPQDINGYIEMIGGRKNWRKTDQLLQPIRKQPAATRVISPG
ncbi:MAG: glycoside hydrolase family 92 protein [Chitinophagaceae bacterium]|nr:glycoside hydrolase family 92 protein [Chitinophagaceae bacterium]